MSTIKITITEEDRQNADRYVANKGCLLFTALKRAGHPVVSVGPCGAMIDDRDYDFTTPAMQNNTHYNRERMTTARK